MTQKELLYIEDIYNHEKLFIKIAEHFKNELSDENYTNIIEDQIKEHNSLCKKLEKLLEGVSNG